MINAEEFLLDRHHPAIDLEKWQRIVDILAEIYGSNASAIVQFNKGDLCVVSASRKPNDFIYQGDSWSSDMKMFCQHVLETRQSLYINDAASDDYWFDSPPVVEGYVNSYYGLLLEWPDKTPFGTICILDNKSTDYRQPFLDILVHFKDLIEYELKVAFQYEEVRELSLTDELTGVYNRRGLFELGKQKIKYAHRFKCPLGAIYLDIDNLKALNDTYGHQAGDLGIIALAKSMKRLLRESDLIARVGGDEFVVLSLSKEMKDLEGLATRISQHYQHVITNQKDLYLLDVSIGYKLFESNDSLSVKAMLDETDKLMYQSKQLKKH